MDEGGEANLNSRMGRVPEEVSLEIVLAYQPGLI